MLNRIIEFNIALHLIGLAVFSGLDIWRLGSWSLTTNTGLVWLWCVGMIIVGLLLRRTISLAEQSPLDGN